MSANPLAQASYNYQRRWSHLRRLLPRPLRRALRACYFLTLDGVDVGLRRRRGNLVPPRWLNPIGDGDFESTGAEFLDYFIRFGGLERSHRVLDVGCGIGRMARPLTRYLATGTYQGFDIVPRGVRWCAENISARYPGFHFSLADIRNREYNPHGLVTASNYRFPHEDASFDFAFLTSVFTHLRPLEVSHYLAELRRVLASGGKCLATFFLINEESRSLIESGQSSLDLSHAIPGCWTTNLRIPETAIGYEETCLMQMIRQQGFTLDSLHFGNWCGRAEYLSYQDVVVLAKR
ncbi:MAG: class I SAM-dependent methyltransferase [Candidatus Sulfotelmatobacter sp.]|jgi:SAM-dependent methyltransferase